MKVLSALLLALGIVICCGQELLSLTPIVDLSGSVARAAPIAAPGIRRHQVLAGEDLNAIADKYLVDIDTLLGANPEISGAIFPGNELVILPQRGALHVAEDGETLAHIAEIYGVAVELILAANNKQDDKLVAGEEIFIPSGRPAWQISRGNSLRFIWPVNGELSSPFGFRWGHLHAGIDIAVDIGVAARAASAGRVIFSGWQGGYGNTVIIEHEQEYSTLYGHLSDYFVESGQYVASGQIVGYTGNTGNSTGPHLHFEVRLRGQPLNPLNFLQQPGSPLR